MTRIYGFRPRIRADDWTLVISATEARDAGTYECSVNTLPKISHTVALAVKEMAMAVREGVKKNWKKAFRLTALGGGHPPSAWPLPFVKILGLFAH